MSNGVLRSFEELGCWKEAQNLRQLLKAVLKKLPKSEDYLLKDQIIRASRSVTNNIAEGYGRYHFKENIQFCRISRGSLHEILDHLIIMKEEGYCTEQEFEELKGKVLLVIKILNGYIQYLAKTAESSKTQ